MEFFFIYSHVKEAKKKADPYIAQAVDAAMRGWDWTKKTASDIQAKVLDYSIIIIHNEDVVLDI